MASKKAGGKKAMPAQAEVKTMPVRLDLPPNLHRLLRIVSSYRNESMASAARNLLADALEEEARKYGVKP